MSAATSTTVDWTGWLNKTAEQQAATWRAYKAIIERESQDARFDNYRRMDRAMYGARHG